MRVLTMLVFLIAISIPLGSSAAWAVGPLEPLSRLVFVFGNDDVNVDRGNLQDAIDHAPHGAILVLFGRFQLDGEAIVLRRAPLTLQGWVTDNDGDGRYNEDWADGVDNDEDGAVDEDGWEAAIQGVLTDDGLPVGEDTSSGLFFNRGLRYHGVIGEQRRLIIRDLEFSGHHRTITIQPEVDSTSNNCVDFAETGGSIERLKIERNLFTNNTRAIQTFGDIRHGRIRHNVMVDGINANVVAVGGMIGCVGDPGFLSTARPTDLRVQANLIRGASLGIFANNTDYLRVERNTIDTTGFSGISSASDPRPWVRNNTIAHATRGVTIAGPSSGGKVVGNTFLDIGDRGVNIIGPLGPVTELRVTRNHFFGTVNEDIRLDANTFDNRVVVGPDDEVNDLGDNTVIVKMNDADSDSDSDSDSD